MRFVSVRDLRNTPGRLWEEVRSQDLVLTANGKPVALLVGLHGDDLEETVRVVKRARAMEAVSGMRRAAAARGLDRLGMDEIDAIIRSTRAERGGA